LSDGTVLEIVYSPTDAFFENKSRSELYIQSINFEPVGSYLAKVDPNDLP